MLFSKITLSILALCLIPASVVKAATLTFALEPALEWNEAVDCCEDLLYFRVVEPQNEVSCGEECQTFDFDDEFLPEALCQSFTLFDPTNGPGTDMYNLSSLLPVTEHDCSLDAGPSACCVFSQEHGGCVLMWQNEAKHDCFEADSQTAVDGVMEMASFSFCEQVCRGEFGIDFTLYDSIQFEFRAGAGQEIFLESNEDHRIEFEWRGETDCPENVWGAYQYLNDYVIVPTFFGSKVDELEAAFDAESSFVDVGNCNGCGDLCSLSTNLRLQSNASFSGSLAKVVWSIPLDAIVAQALGAMNFSYASNGYSWIKAFGSLVNVTHTTTPTPTSTGASASNATSGGTQPNGTSNTTTTSNITSNKTSDPGESSSATSSFTELAVLLGSTILAAALLN